MELIDITLKKLREDRNQDFFIFVGDITDKNVDKFIRLIRDKADRKENCALILSTYGGDPDAGYRIIRSIKKYYNFFTLYVFGFCKSTGTLMALGADEIVMSDFGEFGPLDIQLIKDDELLNMSGLNFVQSIVSLNEQMFTSFENVFFSLKQRSQNSITTKTASEIAAKLSIGLIAPISAQMDPVKLGEVQRAILIANDYGNRLTHDSELVSKLISNYPSHGFVIDYEEAQEIFPNVRWIDEQEFIIERKLIDLVRRPRASEVISEFVPESEKDTEINNQDHLEAQPVDKIVNEEENLENNLKKIKK